MEDDWLVQAARAALWLEEDLSLAKASRLGFIRRRVSREEKARMVAACCRPGASLAVVARRHRVLPARLRRWVRLAGRLDEVEAPGAAPLPAFVRLVLDEAVLARAGGGRRRWGCRAPGCGWADPGDRGPDGVLEALAELDPATSLRIVLATRPVGFGKHHDGLAAVVERELGLDPYSGVVVVFRGPHRRDQVKLLWWEGTSLTVVHKRLERGRFVWPPVHHGAIRLSRAQFQLLFAGLDWRRMLHPRVLGPSLGW